MTSKYIGRSQAVVANQAYSKAEADARFMDINEETLPSQTGNASKYLTTDGTSASWDTLITRSASAPSTPVAGDLWFNTTNSRLNYYDGTVWQRISQDFFADGGSRSESSSLVTHTFTSNGSFVISSGAKDLTVKVLGGGGGGGTGNGKWAAGGGGGGYAEAIYAGVPGTYSVVVGQAGSGQTVCDNSLTGGSGGTSSFNNQIFGNGGGGGGQDSEAGAGGSRSASGAISVTTLSTGTSGTNGGGDGSGGGGQNGGGSTYGSGASGVNNGTPGNHASGYGNGGGGGHSCQDGNHRGGGNGSPGIVIISYEK